MKVKTMSALAGLGGALIMSTAANATLLGLSVISEPVGGGGTPPSGGARTIWRLYANFSATTDRVNAWGAGSDFGPGGIFNRNADDSGPGTNFTNVGGPSGNLAPAYAGTPRDWDTYMTVGLLYASEGPSSADGAAQIPNTPAFIVGNAWTPDPVNGGGVFVTPDMPQGGAAYRVAGADTDHRVLLAQLVVNQGQNVRGTIGVAWEPGGPGAGQTVAGLTFNSFPAPGALALLGLAGLVGAPRRRS